MTPRGTDARGSTHIVQAGVDLPTAAFFTGHKSLEMLRRYVHASTPHVRGALDKLEARYRQADDKTDRGCEMPRPPSYAVERRRGVRRLREQATHYGVRVRRPTEHAGRSLLQASGVNRPVVTPELHGRNNLRIFRRASC